MFVTYPINIDYLIPDVRIHVGDYAEDKRRFSDSIIRTALIGGIKMLQRRWQNRYLVFSDDMFVSPLPSDIISFTEYAGLSEPKPSYILVVPSGHVYIRISDGYTTLPETVIANDVFRNPLSIFLSPGYGVSQEDEYPLILGASMVLRKSQLSSSAESFQSWSDGDFTFSNLGSQRALGELYTQDNVLLDAYFKTRLTSPLRSTFGALVT